MTHPWDWIVAAGSVAVALAAIAAIVWRGVTPLWRIAHRADQVHDVVLGYSAEVDLVTGNIIRPAAPGLIERMDAFGRNQEQILVTIRQMADATAAVADMRRELDAARTEDRKAREEDRKAWGQLRTELETHIRQCETDREMWQAIEALVNANPPKVRALRADQPDA